MKKNKSLILIILIGLVLFFSGCSLNSGSNSNENGFSIGVGTGSNSNGGGSTSGLVLKLDDNYPPSSMQELQPYTFTLIFENYLNHPLNDVIIEPIGFDNSLVKGFDKKYTKSDIPSNTRDGYGQTQLIISGIQSVDLSKNYNFNPTFKYVYKGYTDYLEQICVPDKLNKCNIKVDKSLNQNGPITVKVLRINSLNGKIRIDFKLSNSGSGYVVNPENKFKTDEYATKYNLDSVKLGSIEGDCHSLDGSNKFQLMKQSGTFYCEFDRNSDESYATQLTVNLDYLYNNKVSKRILIENTNQQ